MNTSLRSGLLIGILCSLCTGRLSAYEMTIERSVGDTLTLSWPSVNNKQHRVYCTEDLSLPIAQWELLGTWHVGDGTVLSTSDTTSGSDQKFYAVDESSVFTIDAGIAGYGTIGNSWTYQINDHRESGEDDNGDTVVIIDNYIATYLVDSLVEYPASSGQQTVKVRATRADDAGWEQVLYILDDFSEGIFQVGGVNPASDDRFPGPFTNTPNGNTPLGASVVPLLLNAFTPAVVQDWDYTNSNFGDIDNTITHSLTTYTLPGETEPSTAIKVTSQHTAGIIVVEQPGFFLINLPINITSTVEDTYVPGVGLVKKVIDVDAVAGDSRYEEYSQYIDVTVALQSYSASE